MKRLLSVIGICTKLGINTFKQGLKIIGLGQGKFLCKITTLSNTTVYSRLPKLIQHMVDSWGFGKHERMLKKMLPSGKREKGGGLQSFSIFFL